MTTAKVQKASRKKTTKRLKDVNAPKAPLTPYLQFGNEQRKIDPKINSLPVGEQGKMLSEMWKNLAEDVKEKMKSNYAEQRKKYKKEFEEYKNTDRYKEWAEQKAELVKSEKSKKPKKRNSKSAYNIYFTEQYPIISNSQKDMSMPDIASTVAKKWKSMTSEEKKKYQDAADKINNEIKEKENVKSEEMEDDEAETSEENSDNE